jgi:predicted ATPase/DNA-binding SARP family transcriptional activator
VRFELLGPLRVRDEGADLDLGGPRQQRVLAVLLATTPDDVSVDRLIDEVWPGQPPGTASHVVRTYISNLRGVLGDRITSDGNRYAVEIGDDDNDAAELAVGLRRGRELLDVDAPAAFDLLDRVVRLWRGRPFDGLGDDTLLLRSKAAELEELYAQAVETRFEAALRLGRHESVVAELTSFVDRFPLRERFNSQLMLALYRSGRQAEALRVYGSLRRRLVEELGIDPSTEVQQLEERILLQDAGLALRPPHNIPSPVSSFVGRRVELGEATKQIEAYRMVTLLGVGGVGKTRLAIESATEVLDDFPDGVWWIDLVPLDEPSQVAVRVAEVLGVSTQPGVGLVDVLCRYLSFRTALLVMDNCEHLIEATGRLVAALLAAGPGVKVLATSRRPLSVVGEIRYRVPPLNLPERAGTDTGRDYVVSDAERLFVTRAQDVSPGMTIRPEDVETVALICRGLEGLPLAIEMAAARAAVLSPAQIAARLEEGTALLAASEVDRADRQRTIEAAVAWSYDLLTPLERVAFARLGVFAGSFALDAAAAVAGFDPIAEDQVLDAISGLVEASLLVAEPSGEGPMRYRQLAVLRGFARLRLEESGETTEVERRHTRYHLELAEAAGKFRTLPEFAPWMLRIEAVRDELSPALDWSLENEARSMTLQAVPGLLEYWQRRGDFDPAYRYGTQLLEGADGAPAELRAYALMCASFGAALTGDFALATRGPQQAMDLARDVPGWRCRLWAMMTLGQIGTILGDLEAVEAMGREILDLCDRHHLTLPRAYGLSLLAEAEFFTDGDYATARRFADEAIRGFRGLYDIGGLKIYGLSIAAPVAALQGDLDAAEEYATEAISLPGSAWTAAAYVILGGYVLWPRGDLDRARHVLERGTRTAYETSNEIWMRFGLLFLASLAAREEDWERAAWLFGACRPNLPAWGQQPRWWTAEPLVREAVGEDRFEQLAADGAAAPADVIMRCVDDRAL